MLDVSFCYHETAIESVLHLVPRPQTAVAGMTSEYSQDAPLLVSGNRGRFASEGSSRGGKLRFAEGIFAYEAISRTADLFKGSLSLGTWTVRTMADSPDWTIFKPGSEVVYQHPPRGSNVARWVSSS